FEDVDEPYEDDYKRVIPEKCQWVVVMSLQMSRETLRRAPMVTGAQATMGAYSRMDYLVGATAEFIRGLGYVAIPSVNDTAAIIPFAIQAGLGELARTNRLVTPEYGPVVRLCKIFTDLPLATDKPIEFGVWEFCKKCMKCAEACPPKALSFDPEPSFNTRGPWNNPGHQGWFEDSVKCYTYWQAGPGTNCTICFAVCPFSKPKGILHSFVKTSIAKAPMLDKLFIVGDDIIGYGKQKDPEEWWNLDLDEYGIDGAH
ncbi:MAG: reductive dehalogenase, partial [Dehalococcoidia bacterium]